MRGSWIVGVALFALLGYEGGRWLERWGLLGSPINLVYLTVVGILAGLLVVPRLEPLVLARVERVNAWWRSLPPEVPFAVMVGSILGLLASVLLTTLFAQVPGFAWYHSLLLALVLVSVSSAVVLANREFLRPHANPPARPRRMNGGKALDSSVLIDGRVAEIAELGFLEGPLWVPRFVLRELQMLADSSDNLRRAKGRRGLETLERLKRIAPLEVLEEDAEGEALVDDKLLEVCRRSGAALVTNDAALIQLARIYGVRVLSVQALAAAMRSHYFPGERLKVTILKEGKEPGQGVGYLEDGTMVVVDEAIEHRGKEVQVVVTQAIQTQVGRLLFARIHE